MLKFIISIMFISIITIKFFNYEKYINPIDNDKILGENYFEINNLEDENILSEYIETRNRKYDNMFKGSILNKYYKLVNLEF